jgi:2-hydroxychromene-2-carboxylate isomerase
VEGAQSAIAVHVDPVAFLDAAIGAGAALWRGAGKAKALTPHARARIETGTALRQQRGHFLGATIEYGGEWYWGLDRLHYMEARLQALQAGAGGLIFPLPTSPQGSGKAGGVLDYFLSFRSPYTYLAAERAKALADAYGAELRLRFVLPMVMRGMAVPPMKSRYFTLDCAREARRLGIPFGRIADPLGKPVERGYSLVAWAQAEGRGFEYCLSFMRRVWSEGVDAGQTRGMQRIVEAAGLNWQSAQKHLDSQGWRSEAEANRRDMIALGLWGVPSLRYEDVAVWGQDRLWAIEGAMQNRAQQRALG